MTVATKTKTCTGCKKVLPATPEHFHRNRKAADGLQWQCKTCQKNKVYTGRSDGGSRTDVTRLSYPFIAWLTVDVKQGFLHEDRREESLKDPVLSGEIPLFNWTSLRHDGWYWEHIGPGDRRGE